MKKKILVLMASCFAITCSYSQTINKYDSFAVPIKVNPGAQLSKSINGDISPNRLVTCERPDVRIFPSNVPQSEVHISINKLNNQSLLVSSNTFPIGNSIQGAYWSNNSGTNWQGADVLPNNAFGRGDPSTTYDALGRGYIASMAPNANAAPNGLFIQRTDNNGATWQPQVNATGVINGFDKEMIAADDVPTSPFANNLYSAWTVFGATTSVQFNRSINGGATFTNPIILRNGFGQGTNVQTGPNGEVYVCWADYTNGNLPAQGLGFTRSLNGGVNFTPFAIPFNYAGIRIGNGANANFNNIRVNDFPSMAVDKSNGPRRGRIYVVYAERENGNGKSIIRLRWSANQGTNWSAPVTLSVATARQSWMPWVSVDDTNGNVFVTYFCMENMTNFSSNTFVAASVNGFTTFQNRVVSDVMHVTAAIPQFGGGYAGDYIGMSSNGGRGFAAWMDDRNGTWQNYVSEVRVADIELTGNPLLCGTANTYTLTGVPAGSTVTWQQPAPAGIVTMNTSGNTATLTRNGSANGVVTLSANVSEGTCAYGLFSIQITVGNVTNITGYYRDNYGQNTSLLKSYEGINFVQPNVGSTAIVITPEWAAATWSLENGSCNYWTQSPSPDGNLLVMNLSQGADVDFRLTNNSTCGTEYFDFIFYGQSAYGGYYRISPNPTKGNIDISVDEAKLSANRIAKSSDQDIREIVILDKTGMVQAKQSFGKGTRQMNINIYNLKTGIYIVRIFNGKEWTALKLVKE